MPSLTFVVDRREAGQTLASALKKRYGLSWSQAKRLVEGQHVRVGQQVETDAARRLKLGKKVYLESGSVELKSANRGAAKADSKTAAAPARKPGPKPRPAALPLPKGIDIVYADDALVVAYKPAGLTTMRHKDEVEEYGDGQRFLTPTLAGALPRLLGVPDRRVVAVHRIDRDTSGLVVFARTAAAADHLTEQFRKHTVERKYLALTRGVPKPGKINTVLVADRGDGRRGTTRKKHPADGKRAVTRVQVLEVLGDFAAVECRLETGRTHQVRIHLGEIGTPLCGERVYDRAVNSRPVPDESGAERPMLHAARLGFVHPETGEKMAWDAKPPADFAAVLAKLRPA